MASLALIILAAMFKAVADTLQHHFWDSVFSNKNPLWWNPAQSWKHVKFLPRTKYRPDAWHLANSAMILCFVLAAVVHAPFIHWALELAIFGAAFILVFNRFYNKTLLRARN